MYTLFEVLNTAYSVQPLHWDSAVSDIICIWASPKGQKVDIQSLQNLPSNQFFSITSLTTLGARATRFRNQGQMPNAFILQDKLKDRMSERFMHKVCLSLTLGGEERRRCFEIFHSDSRVSLQSQYDMSFFFFL